MEYDIFGNTVHPPYDNRPQGKTALTIETPKHDEPNFTEIWNTFYNNIKFDGRFDRQTLTLKQVGSLFVQKIWKDNVAPLQARISELEAENQRMKDFIKVDL